MFREPWFEILAVTEDRGPSLADIAARVAQRHGLTLSTLRGIRQDALAVSARHEFYRECRALRPDLSSTRVGLFINRDGSCARRIWRRVSQ